MLNDNNFYADDDVPTPQQKNAMWKSIEKGIKPEKRIVFRIKDLPSFYYGIAATFIFFFAAIGIYTSAKQFIYNAKPEEIKLNTAYQSAINEFEKVVPSAISTMPQSINVQQYIAAKKEQLEFINSAINEFKKENGNTDLNALKQIRLRQLYNAKLKVLQEIIDKGEVDL